MQPREFIADTENIVPVRTTSGRIVFGKKGTPLIMLAEKLDDHSIIGAFPVAVSVSGVPSQRLVLLAVAVITGFAVT